MGRGDTGIGAWRDQTFIKAGRTHGYRPYGIDNSNDGVKMVGHDNVGVGGDVGEFGG